MIENNESLNSSSSQGEQNKPIENDLGNTTFTQEEIEAANKPQPNVILSKGGDSPATGYRDNERVPDRANEAADSTDTNTGGMIAGAAKGANQS